MLISRTYHVWLGIGYLMSTECTLCVIVSMQFSIWTFFMGNLILFSNFNESKNASLYSRSHCSQKNIFIFVMQAKIEYKRQKKKSEKWNLQLLYLTSMNAVCNNIGWWVFLNTHMYVFICGSFCHRQMRRILNFLYKYADVTSIW